MSRLFNGTSDVMGYPAPAAMSGAVSMLVVVKFATASGWASLIEMTTAGAGITSSIGRNNNEGQNLYWANNHALLAGGVTLTDTTNWLIVGMSRPAGGTAQTRCHSCIIGGANTHADNTGTAADADSAVGGSLRLGGDDDFFSGRLAVAAIWSGTALTDANFNSINTAKTTQSIIDLSPTWLVDDSDAFATDLIGSVDRTSISGTTDDADDPSGWVYGIGGSSPITDAPERLRIVQSNLRSA